MFTTSQSVSNMITLNTIETAIVAAQKLNRSVKTIRLSAAAMADIRKELHELQAFPRIPTQYDLILLFGVPVLLSSDIEFELLTTQVST
jgi:hypothetical protein